VERYPPRGRSSYVIRGCDERPAGWVDANEFSRAFAHGAARRREWTSPRSYHRRSILHSADFFPSAALAVSNRAPPSVVCTAPVTDTQATMLNSPIRIAYQGGRPDPLRKTRRTAARFGNSPLSRSDPRGATDYIVPLGSVRRRQATRRSHWPPRVSAGLTGRACPAVRGNGPRGRINLEVQALRRTRAKLLPILCRTAAMRRRRVGRGKSSAGYRRDHRAVDLAW